MRRVANLLNQDLRSAAKVIDKLESLSGYQSQDVKLLADIQRRLPHKIAALGLDPADTTPQELHYTLKAKLDTDLAHLTRACHLDNRANLLKLLQRTTAGSQLLAIKGVAVKKILRANPPKKTMKQLGYRSLDSMLKRCDISLVLALTKASESQAWQTKTAHAVGRLKSQDWEIRQLKFIDVPIDGFMLKAVPLMACIALGREDNPGLTVLKALQAVETAELTSHYLSKNQFSQDFNKIAERLFCDFEPKSLNIAGEVYLNYLEAARLELGGGFADKFAHLHPALKWWKSTGHLASEQGELVSLHIADVAAALSNKLDFEQRQFKHLAQQFKHQLLGHYYSFDAVRNYINLDVDDTLLTLEELKPRQTSPVFEEVFD